MDSDEKEDFGRERLRRLGWMEWVWERLLRGGWLAHLVRSESLASLRRKGNNWVVLWIDDGLCWQFDCGTMLATARPLILRPTEEVGDDLSWTKSEVVTVIAGGSRLRSKTRRT